MVREPKGRTRRWNITMRPEIDDLLEREAKKRGISKTDLVESIIIEWCYRNGYNKILHINFRNDTITIWDELLNETVDLVYKPDDKTLFCMRCKTTRCGHIYAATQIPEVKRKIEKKEIFIDEF